MSEIAFPILGAIFVVAVALPASALVARGLLALLRVFGLSSGARASTTQYLILVLSSLLPVAYFVSAAAHQAETSASALSCLWVHRGEHECFEAGMFAAALVAILFASAAPAIRRQVARREFRGSTNEALSRRVQNLVASTPALRDLAARVRCVSHPSIALGTTAWLRPCIVVGDSFAARLDDESLRSALLHEAAHVRAFDPLRYALIELALALNPFGRFALSAHAAEWTRIRELGCDRDAVVRGASALALADAIVAAARHGGDLQPSLGGDVAWIRFRVNMLVAFSENAPDSTPASHAWFSMPIATLVLLLATVLPHRGATGGLDVIHSGSERVATLVSGQQ